MAGWDNLVPQTVLILVGFSKATLDFLKFIKE